MNTERIKVFFDAMADKKGGINTFVSGSALDHMLGRSFEAVIPILEKAHDAIVESGRPVVVADGIATMALKCPEGPHGGVWRKAIAFQHGGKLTISVLEMSGEPDPAFDAFFEAQFPGHSKKAPPSPGPCFKIRVYETRGATSAFKVLADDTKSVWRSDMAFESSMTSSYTDWRESHRNVCGRIGLDVWPQYFSMVGSLIKELGLSDSFETIVSELRTRNWQYPDKPDFAQYNAAHLFGAEIAMEDGCLPGDHCVAAWQELETISAEIAMRDIGPALIELANLMSEHSEILDDGDFSANDGRTIATPITRDDGAFQFKFEDQNNIFGVVCHDDQISITSERGKNCLSLNFARQPDDTYKMSGAIGPDADSIRSWNGFKSFVETIVCCAKEEVKFKENRIKPG